MTNIATKNGAVVVKDGSVGTDCGCCGSGLCVCDATSVSVQISASNFVRKILWRDPVYGGEARFTYAFVAAPSSGTFELHQVEPGIGLSASRWKSDDVAYPGAGQIIASFSRADGNSPFGVIVGIPVFYMRASGFLSLEEMIGQSPYSGTGHGSIVATMVCTQATGRVLALSFPDELSSWDVNGATIPFTACDFLHANFLNGLSSAWYGHALQKGEPEPFLQQNGWVIEQDIRDGNNIVTLQGMTFTCSQDNPLP